ncbi:MAG: hypothetical protein ACYSTN_04930 [Planctomycetota bacterium]
MSTKLARELTAVIAEAVVVVAVVVAAALAVVVVAVGDVGINSRHYQKILYPWRLVEQ